MTDKVQHTRVMNKVHVQGSKLNQDNEKDPNDPSTIIYASSDDEHDHMYGNGIDDKVGNYPHPLNNKSIFSFNKNKRDQLKKKQKIGDNSDKYQ